jgi:hypothetical protein
VAKRKSRPKARTAPHRAVSLVQQARRVAQLEAVRRRLRRQVRETDDRLRAERKFLRAMADPRPALDVGEL